ncbi:DUF5011 domain-containing protein [Vibrio campbellii]|uniref:DUF5011 domain-containing protein n=1 Tax=Vibrio campbellii TaxID=680 RepID=UPI0038CD9E94
MTNNNNVTEVYNVRNIAWTASNVNKLLATLAVSSLLSGCGGGGGGDSDSTPAAKPPIENKKDEIPPVITLVGSKSITVYLNDKFEDPGFTATDNVDGDISKRVKVSYDKPIDTDTVGTYTITYTVTDKAGNKAVVSREVKVESKAIPAPDVESDKDTEKPQITLKGGEEIIVYLNDEFQDPGFTATDNVDGDISNRVQVSGKPDTDTVGTYTITYKVTDKAGNKATASRKVTVKSKAVADIEKPQITLKGGEEITVYLNDEFQDPGFTATDNVDGDISKRVQVSGKADTGTVGTYTLTYKVTDTAGNEATAKRVVEVVEGIVFRDSDIVLYENEYQHRIWYDVKSDNIDASKITFELSEQSTATVDKAQGQTLDVELVEVKNSTSKSGYFTLAIHDDEEFEGKERIVVNVLSDKAFVKELNIDLDDGALTRVYSSTNFTDSFPKKKLIVLDDTLYAFDRKSIVKYDLIKKEEITKNSSPYTYFALGDDDISAAVYEDNIYMLIRDKLYLLNKNDLSLIEESKVPLNFNFNGYNAKVDIQITKNTVYVFATQGFYSKKPNYFSYELTAKEWAKLPQLPENNQNDKKTTLVRTTRVHDNKIHVYQKSLLNVFDMDINQWSEANIVQDKWHTPYGEDGVWFSDKTQFVGNYAYDFMHGEYEQFLSRYNFETESMDERRILYVGIDEGSDSFLYKGRVHRLNKQSSAFALFYMHDQK